MNNVSRIFFRLQRVADFGKSQFFAIHSATIPPSNKNRLEVNASRSKIKERPLHVLYLKCQAIWDFSSFILFPFIGDLSSIKSGIPFKRMNKSGKPTPTRFSSLLKNEPLGRTDFISLPSVFSLDILYGKN